MATVDYLKFNMSPVEITEKQQYVYFAEYEDGSYFYEFDNDGNKYKFDDLDQEKTVKFGLLGNRLKTYFFMKKCNFFIGPKGYHINVYKEDGSRVEYENTEIKKDLITFKTAHTDCTFDGVNEGNVIETFNVGFKMNLENSLYLSIVFVIPVYGPDRRPFFGVKLSNKENAKYTVELTAVTDDVDSSKFSKEEINLEDGKSMATQLYFN